MPTTLSRIAVFCGSALGARPDYADAAKKLGHRLAERGIGLVYGGAATGTMGVVADAVLAAGGSVTGVIPRHLVDREIAHTGLSELLVVEDMHERKATMAANADGFIALPGGAGTLEEFFEVWTWGLLGLHLKPCALLDVAGFYQPLLYAVDRMVGEQFLAARHREMLLHSADTDDLLDRMASYTPPPPKWTVPADAAPAQATTPTIDALAWIHIVDGALLAVRTTGRDAFYLPGGKREPGESDAAALSREIHEELGIKLRPDTLTLSTVVVDTAHGQPDGTQVRMACYVADHDGEPVGHREIAELAWVTSADADRLAPAARTVLAELHGRGLVG